MITDVERAATERDLIALYGPVKDDAIRANDDISVGSGANDFAERYESDGFRGGDSEYPGEAVRAENILPMDRPAGSWETRVVRRWVEVEERFLALRVSALAGCLRKAYYEISGYERTDRTPARYDAIRDVGNAIEGVVVEMLRAGGEKLADGRVDLGWDIRESQTEVFHSLGDIELQGHIDAIGSHPRWTGGLAVVVEIKTRSHSQKEYAYYAGVERSHPGAAMQAAIYAVALAGSVDAAGGAVVVTVSRDDMSHALNYLPKERVGALYSQAAERARGLKDSLESETAPPPEYNRGHKICRLCEFRSMCGNAEIAGENGVEGALSDEAVVENARAYVAAQSSKRVKDRAKDALKAHMIACGLERLEISIDDRRYSLTCPALVKREVDMDEFNSRVDPDIRDEILVSKTSHQFRMSAKKDI